MTVQRKTVEFAKVIAYDRVDDPYVYGGNWDPFNRGTGTDCSGCVVDELDAVINGTAMAWSRHGLSTENWRPPAMGGGTDPNNAPFGTRIVDSPTKIPANAAVKIALHHGPGGGANSHMWCQVDSLAIETNGDDGTVLGNNALAIDDSYANCWAYLPGPIVEDGTPLVTGPSSAPTEPPDTLFADVSEFQAPVDDSFTTGTYSDGGGVWPYRWLSIRSNDGAHVDKNFAANYAWCTKACASGILDGFFVYYYWRPDGSGVTNHTNLVTGQGGPHPQMVSMIDVESGDGNGSADRSAELNGEYNALATWLGNRARVIGYGNTGDLNNIWGSKPPGLRLIVAGYGSNPDYPGKIAHQYTDGTGFGGGLPEGVAPFGNCDMNSADNLSPSALAAVLGVTTVPPPIPIPTPPPPTPGDPFLAWVKDAADRQLLEYIVDQLGPGDPAWSSKGETLRDFLWGLQPQPKQAAAKKAAVKGQK